MPTPLPVDPAEAVIPNVEQGASITFWTYYLSPTIDAYIRDTIDRFERTYPGVEVTWEDHKATYRQDLNNAFAKKAGPDVINLSAGEGWVREYATKGLLLGLDATVPAAVRDGYFPGLWKDQLVKGVNYQFPWYQTLEVELVNLRLYSDEAGLDAADFPKKVGDLPGVCQTIKAKTGKLCAIRLGVEDLLSQMAWEGDVDVMNAAGTAFTFDSKAAVAWLQMYVDMVKDGTVDGSVLTATDDKVGRLLFAAGQAPFYLSAPIVARDLKTDNPTVYENLLMKPPPMGLSGVLGRGLMSISVNAMTKYPNASLALAQFFTNPRSMVEFSRRVAIYPSSPAAYDDPYFAPPARTIEEGALPLAEGIVSTYADVVPVVPRKADVNAIVLKAVESALYAGVPADKALSTAVAAANKLIK